MSNHISSVVLAGGRSLRMGTDKALLRLRPDGPTLIESVVASLTEAGLPPALLVTERPESYSWLNIPSVGDEIRGTGALGGIYTALVHSMSPRTLVVACDMPLLNPALLHYMALLPLQAGALVPRWQTVEGVKRVEPLHSIYTRHCVEPLRLRIDTRILKVSDALADLDVSYLEDAELRRFDPYLKSFRNVNTPEEWQALLSEAHV